MGKMTSTVLCAVILLACALTLSAAQKTGSCKSRCGAEYYRGYMCQCDYNCLSYGECCKDFESQCTTKNSCKGRCGEGFRRGRLCSCDSDCAKYKQCCPDHNIHCDAEEEVSGAASSAPMKTNSCDNANDNKPKESIEAPEPSTFSEGNDADDHLIPLVVPTSYPEDDLSIDPYGELFPNDEFSNGQAEDPEAKPIPESTSGYDSSTADQLDLISTEPTQDPDTLELSTETFTVLPQTQTTVSSNEPTQPDDSSPSLYPATEEAPTESAHASDPTSASNRGTTLPQPTTVADQVSSQPTLTSVPQTEYSPTANTPELETPPVPTAHAVLEISKVTTIPTSTLDPTAIPEATTTNISPDDTENNTGRPSPLADLGDPSDSVSPSGNLTELDAQTTHIPSSTEAGQDNTADQVTPRVTTAQPLKVTPDPTTSAISEVTTKAQEKPDPYKPSAVKPTPVKPSSKPQTKPLDNSQTPNVDDPRDFQADDSNDTNLCSGRPISAVTTLRNGTIVIFRGHYFWSLDRNMVAGPARGITQVWGVPSPIDTAFTRCNCQGKTYIFKGSQYWRFENDVLDPNYPMAINTGFDGLRGQVTAALSVPQYRKRRESVYFFKRGGLVQKYSYQFGTSPTCGRKVQYAIYTVRNRVVRQAVPVLGPAVSVRTSWRGFPSTITAAVSVPSTREREGYKYYVFSKSKSYNVRMDSERPVIAAPKANASPQSNDFFKCSN